MGKRRGRPLGDGRREGLRAAADAPAELDGDASHQVHGSNGIVIGDHATQVNYFGGQPDRGGAVKLPEGDATGVARASRVTFWGAPASGKTTYLAALNQAAREARPRWTVTGMTDASTSGLSEWTIGLVRARCFPAPTYSVDHWSFRMTGRPFGSRVEFDLGIQDASGELFRPGRDGDPAIELRSLIDGMRSSDGIVLFYDPVREQQCHDALDAFKATAALLEHKLGIRDGDPLPHHVAVVIVKYDHPSVLAAARDGGYLVRDLEDPCAFPRVADDHSPEFLDELYRRSNPGGGDLFRRSIEAYFDPERIRYFTVSSIGFHLDRPGTFDWDDYYNVVHSDPGSYPCIRGDIRPVNVLEPMLWLAAPDLYPALTRQRRLVRMSQQAHKAPSAERRDRAAGRSPVGGAPGRASHRKPDHLIWLVETSNQPEVLEGRLEQVWQVTSIAVDRNPELRVSLIYYGSHSFSSSLAEEYVEVLAWDSDHAFVTAVLYQTGLGGRVPAAENRAPVYALSAQVECALAETARRLDGTGDVAAIVTVGKRPAAPPHMAEEVLGLPCPARNNWRELISQLRDDHGAVFGSLHERWDYAGWLPGRGNPQFWQEMGMHAEADLQSADIPRFAARLGLVESDLLLPDPLKPPWSASPASTGPPAEPPTHPDLPPLSSSDELIPLNWDDE